MNRKLAIFAAAIATLSFTCQVASARARKEIDPRITGVSWVVGGAATGAYYAGGASTAGAWLGATFGCAAVSPIVATVVLNRPLKYREAHILVGSCIVPIVGGWLVNEAYNAGILWAPDEKPVKKARRAKKK